jgi:hypothetical protein
MSYNFRDMNPVLGAGAQIELNNGAGAPTLVSSQLFESVTINNIAAAGATNQVLWTAPPAASAATGALPLGSYKLLGVSLRYSTASTSGTLQIEKTPSATAVGSGTNQLAATVSLSSTANTVNSGFPATNVASANQLIGPGDSLSAIFAGTVTNLVGLTITLYIARV